MWKYTYIFLDDNINEILDFLTYEKYFDNICDQDLNKLAIDFVNDRNGKLIFNFWCWLFGWKHCIIL